MRTKRSAAIAVMLLTVLTVLLAWSAVRQSPTVDEPVHLSAGVRIWDSARFDLNRGNPPLVGLVAGLPVALARPATNWKSKPYSGRVADDFLAANESRSFRMFTLGRFACIPFSLLGGYICWRWARELLATRAAFWR